MEIEKDTIDDAVLGLLRLALHELRRACRGMDWPSPDRLHRKGLIRDRVNKTESYILTA